MDTIICKGSSIPLRPDIVPLEASFLWSTGASNPEIIVSETNAYTLSITDESTHCVATDTIMVSVRPFPDFTYRPTDTVFCPGSTLVLEALSLAQAELDFSWPDGSTGDEYTVPAAGNIVLLASDGPCQDTLMFNIPPGDCLAPVYAPTAFSPNDDGRNDLFRLLGPNIQIKQFRIFDRWGSLLYQSEDATAAWDGHTAGAPANPGLYLYQVVYLNERSLQMEERSGEIILIR
jgi:gliding motility-associated-like protein